MGSPSIAVVCFALIALCCHGSLAARELVQADRLVEQSSSVLEYHKGPLLSGMISVNLIWYGSFKAAQRSIVLDFLDSLSGPADGKPSVATWWKGTQKYYKSQRPTLNLKLSIGTQISDDTYSMGKKLSADQIVQLASRGGERNAVNVVLTSADVAVEGFCSIKCGSHGSGRVRGKASKFAYIWVGNAEEQCPGHCAWPFHRPIYGPQSPALIAPNNDVGMDGLVSNLASLMVGTVTNPFGNGYFQGPKEAPMEASSGCAGVYGKGAYPGYAGELMVDGTSGASYNARGVNGRKYLLPAMMDPGTSTCATLV